MYSISIYWWERKRDYCKLWKKFSSWLCFKNRYGFVHIGRVGSVLATLSVTVERFFAIVYPLKRIRRTRFLIYSSIIVAIIYNIPRFFEFKTNYCLEIVEDDLSNHTSNVTSKEEKIEVRIREHYLLWYDFHVRILDFQLYNASPLYIFKSTYNMDIALQVLYILMFVRGNLFIPCM